MERDTHSLRDEWIKEKNCLKYEEDWRIFIDCMEPHLNVTSKAGLVWVLIIGSQEWLVKESKEMLRDQMKRSITSL